MTDPKIVIKTIMGKADYHRFLYLATLFKNKWTFPLVIALAFLGSLLVNWDNNSYMLFALTWALMFLLAIGFVCFKVERKNKQRIVSDKTGSFDSISILKFFDDKVLIENKSLHSTGEIRYDQFYRLLESKAYFIFYLTANQASLIRKKDIENLDAFKAFIRPKFINNYQRISH